MIYVFKQARCRQKSKALPCLRNDMQKEGKTKKIWTLWKRSLLEKESGTGSNIIITLNV